LKLIDFVLAHNARFVVAERQEPLSRLPAKKAALFTCMDTRLVEFLEEAMGLKRGEAMVIKNAGNTLIDPAGGVIRSLVVAVFVFGCEEVFVVGHLDCGMSQIDEPALERTMVERGVPAEAIASLQPSLKEWVGSFYDPRANVARVVQSIRQTPLIPTDVLIHGMLFDPHTGHLELIDSG
jgi:carbonic anhydrase